ncbi:cupin domain-containing protein [Streptomyces sp. BE20]|uniref:cupin domain-containing protein n=1 Tax=Streptomyces sp. BE20 TaxID=3002525 RepID=UPI002E77FF9A|nr:cupin domain-containing protein [Streptomyces sp. BE20]MEE1823631.1 cupin domain-containing protein [Streptomyces sp. BE20]
MRSAIVVADTGAPAAVHGVHGAAGVTEWTCLARRVGLTGAWEAVEWARVPVGGVSGEHLHTRTREIYVLLAGEGEVTLDGRPCPVRSGDAVLTAVGTRHGLRNTGAEPLEWLVIELPADPTEEDPDRAGDDGGRRVGSTVITDLRRTGPLDPSAVIGGPLRLLHHAELAPGESTGLVADGAEHTVFVTGGGGRTDAGSVRAPLRPGTALTLPHGTAAGLAAGPSGLAYVHAELVLPGGERR